MSKEIYDESSVRKIIFGVSWMLCTATLSIFYDNSVQELPTKISFMVGLFIAIIGAIYLKKGVVS